MPFKGDRCPSLIGKPKLFFIQACQGRRNSRFLDPNSLGRTTSRSSSPGSPSSSCRRSPVSPSFNADDEMPEPGSHVHMRRIPVEADCLFCYSTVPGAYSWRNNQEGSWFIQALCIVLENYGSKMELMHMLTHVNRIVAYEFASCTEKGFGTQQQERNTKQCKTLQLPKKSKLPIEWKMFRKMCYIQSYSDKGNNKESRKLYWTHVSCCPPAITHSHLKRAARARNSGAMANQNLISHQARLGRVPDASFPKCTRSITRSCGCPREFSKLSLKALPIGGRFSDDYPLLGGQITASS
ncbi:hypothetical protein RRG08_014913 [Elysia crispata]|uniref:Uncharacterized protein n=1 Tax=Elysia crispata TaxID=231223 RepID=A0AAE0ZWX0_9GAST|nr:hypothetical protein RRG08_014913 [Elysia crispata]